MNDAATQTELYSDEWLTEAEAGKHGKGYRNAASYLAKLDTIERRNRAIGEAYTLMNVVGSRFSDGVYDAVSAILHLIAKDEENSELYGEKTARIAREADTENRRVIREMGQPVNADLF